MSEKEMLITTEMVHQAIKLTKPSAIAILKTKGAVWGPELVNGFVNAPGASSIVPFSFHAEDKDVEWDKEWGNGPEEFTLIAERKLRVIMREKANSSVIAKLKPWLLKPGEFMYAGGAYEDGIGVSGSGAKGWADEAISQNLITNLKMLALLEAERRTISKKMQI